MKAMTIGIMAKKWLNNEAIDILCDYYYPKAAWLQDNVNWGQLDYEGPEANKEINEAGSKTRFCE